MVSDEDILKFVSLSRLMMCLPQNYVQKMVHCYLACQCDKSNESWSIPIKEKELSTRMIIHFLQTTCFKDMLQYELFWKIASILTKQFYLKVTEISFEQAVENMKMFLVHFSSLNAPQNCQVNYVYHSDKLIKTLEKLEKNHCIRRITGQFNTLNEIKEIIACVKTESKNNEFVCTSNFYSINNDLPLITFWYLIPLNHVFSKLLTVDTFSTIYNIENLKEINYTTITDFIYV